MRYVPGSNGRKFTRAFTAWQNMRQRCTNVKCPEYKRYGKRGIKMCKRWHIFENFYADMGPPPDGLSLERKDSNGNYNLLNCIWATTREQGVNRRNTVKVVYNGKLYSANLLARELGLSSTTVNLRIKRGWPIEMIASKQNFRHHNPLTKG